MSHEKKENKKKGSGAKKKMSHHQEKMPHHMEDHLKKSPMHKKAARGK